MSDRIEDGGPAFHSITIDNGDNYNAPTKYYHKGMSLRDWFATHASEEDIQEFLPRTKSEEAEFVDANGFKPTRQWARYKHADAMLAARREAR